MTKEQYERDFKILNESYEILKIELSGKEEELRAAQTLFEIAGINLMGVYQCHKDKQD